MYILLTQTRTKTLLSPVPLRSTPPIKLKPTFIMYMHKRKALHSWRYHNKTAYPMPRCSLGTAWYVSQSQEMRK